VNFAENVQFANAPGYQLRVLRAEIKDDKSFHGAKLTTDWRGFLRISRILWTAQRTST
jgi:hypothetical protein